MNNAIIYLHNIQNEYYHILKSKEQIVFSDDLNLVEITMIIEEIDIFWRKNRDKILFDLDYFDDKETLFLAGSMYLDIDDNCHYYFKTFGDENIINDPILKFQNITNNDVNAAFDIISIFKRSFKNTLSLLENFSSYFYILPVDYIISVYNDELIEMKNKIFYQLLSSLLDCDEILSNELFFENFDSIDEIENILEYNTPYNRFKETVEERPNQIVLKYMGRNFTYKEFSDLVDTMAKGFYSLGIRKDDVVTISMLGTPYGIASFYALDKIGACQHMVNSANGLDELKREFENFDSKYFVANDIFCNDETIAALKECGVEHIVTSSLLDGMPNVMNYDKAKYAMVEKLKGMKPKHIDR